MKDIKSLPNGWARAQFNDVCEIISGKNQKDVIDGGGKYPIYGSGGKMGLANQYLCDVGTTVVGRKGTINSPIFVKEKFWNVDTAFGLSPNSIYDKLLFHFFCLSFNFKKLDKSTTIPSLAKTDLLQIPIPLPPLREQKQIVEKLEELFSDLDKGIESLETAQQQLKVYRQAVLKWAFEGKLTNKNVKDGQLPAGWKLLRVDAIAYLNPKLPFNEIQPDIEVSFLPMKLVEEIVNKINLTEFRHYSAVKKGFTPMTDGDVIFAKITPCMENGKIAIVHSLRNKIGFGSTEFHVFRCKSGFFNKYLFHYLIQERVRQEAAKNMTGAVGQRRVPKKFLEEMLMAVPPTLQEQQNIVLEIENRLSVCDKIEESILASLQQAEALRQSILKKAFEGKLVPQDPSDEPASVLLERLRADRDKQKQVKAIRPKISKRAKRVKVKL